MTTRPSYLSTTPDYPPPEDLYSWLPSQHPALAPSPFLSPEQSLPPLAESPSSQFVSVATQEEGSLASNTMLSVPPSPQDKGKGRSE